LCRVAGNVLPVPPAIAILTMLGDESAFV
jgi:hypothetical protein